MRIYFPICLTVLLALSLSASAQNDDKMSWKKHAKLAENLYNNSQFADAGEHYRSAWKKKTKKKELIYKAGESFYAIRDYANAADCWQHVKDDYATWPLIGLQYARVLKQNGQYEAASSELVNFLSKYNGTDKPVVSAIVQHELSGCELAAQYAMKGANANILVDHLSSNINTPETEFAPFPFGEDVVYFSSTMGKRAGIFRSIQSGGEWAKAAPIENFPAIEKDHFCNGSLTPDAMRFYFTVCKAEESWGGLTTKCQIYVTRRVGKTWAAPEKLPDYLNEQNVTTTHPFVVHDGNTEVLYFASNRSGGVGNMDIWYTTREISSTANDFTLPINLGTSVNTPGDDITPYYDHIEGMLYFSSNGQPGIGGLDVFKVRGARSNWQRVENAGTPINSPADDFFFIKNQAGKGGFFVSNRTFGNEKLVTTDEDIFAFSYLTPIRQWVAAGQVINRNSGNELHNAEVSLYEIMGSGQQRFITKTVAKDGQYSFPVEPSKKYYLEAYKEGYSANTYEFDTYDFAAYSDFGAPIYLEPAEMTGGAEPVAAKEKPSRDAVKTAPVSPPALFPVATTKPATKEKPENPIAAGEPAKEEPKPTPSVKPSTTPARQPAGGYKIQVAAVSKSSLDQPLFNKVKKFGVIETEVVEGKALYRVMIGGYTSREDALGDLATIKAMREFSGAFVVEYKNGKRLSRPVN